MTLAPSATITKRNFGKEVFKCNYKGSYPSPPLEGARFVVCFVRKNLSFQAVRVMIKLTRRQKIVLAIVIALIIIAILIYLIFVKRVFAVPPSPTPTPTPSPVLNPVLIVSMSAS